MLAFEPGLEFALAPTRIPRTRFENPTNGLFINSVGLMKRPAREVRQPGSPVLQKLLVPLVAGLAAHAVTPTGIRTSNRNAS